MRLTTAAIGSFLRTYTDTQIKVNKGLKYGIRYVLEPQFNIYFKYWTREEHRLRVFENRMLMRMLGPKRDEVEETGRNCIMRSFIT
jgi:hypothetical protein